MAGWEITENSDGEVCLLQGDRCYLVMMKDEELELFKALGQRQVNSTECDVLESCERCPLCKRCDYCGKSEESDND